MSLLKELYIEEVERIISELEEQGIDEDAAYEQAGEAAYDAVRDRLADLGDRLKDERKEGR